MIISNSAYLKRNMDRSSHSAALNCCRAIRSSRRNRERSVGAPFVRHDWPPFFFLCDAGNVERETVGPLGQRLLCLSSSFPRPAMHGSCSVLAWLFTQLASSQRRSTAIYAARIVSVISRPQRIVSAVASLLLHHG